MGNLLGGLGGPDVAASGMLANTATGGGAGWSLLANDPTIQALLASSGGGGAAPSAGLLSGNIGGPRQVPPLGPVVQPPSLGLSTFPQLGQQSSLRDRWVRTKAPTDVTGQLGVTTWIAVVANERRLTREKVVERPGRGRAIERTRV